MTNYEQFQSPNPNLASEGRSSSMKPSGLQAGIGLAVASFVLGLVSLPLSLFVVGAGTGLIGFILAIIHLSKKLPFKGMAVCGLVLSVVGGTAGGLKTFLLVITPSRNLRTMRSATKKR